MSSKRGGIKRTKNVRNLDSFDAPSLAQSIIEEHSNIIPVGRQLERTPPSKSERVTIHQPSKPNGSPTSGQVVKEELCGQEITKHLSCNGSNEVLQHPKVKDERMSVRRSSSTAASATPGNANPEIFIQGMEGYQWTDTDLEFVYQTKWKKQIQQAQQELSNLQWSLKSTRQTRDMELAALDKIQTELSKVSACERIQQISTQILLRFRSSSQLEGLDLKALLAQLKVADVHCTTAEEKTEVSKLKTEVEKAQVLREKEKQLTKDIDSYKKNITQIKVNIDALTTEISALESQLSSKEEFSTLAHDFQFPAEFSSNPNQTHLNKTLESLESYRQEAPQSAKPRQKAQRGTKPSTAPKPPNPPSDFKPPASPPASKTSKPPASSPSSKTSKPSVASKTSKPPASSRSLKTSKPLAAPKTSEPPASPPVPKSSKPLTAPKTSKPLAAPKTSKPSAASKTSKPPSSPPAPKTSKPTATQKAKTASKPSKPTTAPKAPEGDVGDLRRSKRIAAKKEK